MTNICNNICNKCSSQFDPRFSCTNCDGGELCEEIYYSSCVYYSEDCLSCYGIEPGDTLTTVIVKLLDFAFKECTPTTTTSTTSTTTTSTSTTSTTTCACYQTTEYRICDSCH
jgi:hypothetical protein